MGALDEFAEFFWEMHVLFKEHDKKKFMGKAKPLIKDLIKEIRSKRPLQ